MLVYLQAAGEVSFAISGAGFTSVQFHPENLGPCTIKALSKSQVTIAGTDGRLCVLEVEVGHSPSGNAAMVATADESSEIEFQALPFGKPSVHVLPGQSVVVFEQLSQFRTVGRGERRSA